MLPDGRFALSLASWQDASEMGRRLARRLVATRPARAWKVIGPCAAVEGFQDGWGDRSSALDDQSDYTLRQTLLRLRLPGSRKGDGGTPCAGHLRRARPSDAPLLRSWMRAFDAETGAPSAHPPAEAWVAPAIAAGDAFIWENEGGAPLGTASIGGRSFRGGRIHLVYVERSARRAGVASAAVLALVGLIGTEGLAEATLFADARAAGPLALYVGLGFEALCEFVEVTLSS